MWICHKLVWSLSTWPNLTWDLEFKNHKSRRERKRPILHSLGSFLQISGKIHLAFTDGRLTGCWRRLVWKWPKVQLGGGTVSQVQGGQTNFGLFWRQINRCFLGSYTGVTFDSDYLCSYRCSPLIPPSSVAYLRGSRRWPKLIFRFFRVAQLGAAGPRHGTMQPESWAIYNKSRR